MVADFAGAFKRGLQNAVDKYTILDVLSEFVRDWAIVRKVSFKIGQVDHWSLYCSNEVRAIQLRLSGDELTIFYPHTVDKALWNTLSLADPTFFDRLEQLLERFFPGSDPTG